MIVVNLHKGWIKLYGKSDESEKQGIEEQFNAIWYYTDHVL